MGFFDFLKSPDINQGVEECRNTSGAVLLDVRTVEEYREGHIPGSRNVPLQSIDRVSDGIPDRETPLYVYCRSGARSSQAVSLLQQMGYSKAKNIGGITAWKGKVER